MAHRRPARSAAPLGADARAFSAPELWLAPCVDVKATREELRTALARAMAPTNARTRGAPLYAPDGYDEEPVLQALLQMACRVQVRRAWLADAPEPLKVLVEGEGSAGAGGTCILPVPCGMLAMHLFAHALEKKQLPTLDEASAPADGVAYLQLLELALEVGMGWLAHAAASQAAPCFEQMDAASRYRLLDAVTSPRTCAAGYEWGKLREAVCRDMWRLNVPNADAANSAGITRLLHARATLALGARGFGQLLELLPADVLDAQPCLTSPPLRYDLRAGSLECILEFEALLDDRGEACRWQMLVQPYADDEHIGAFIRPLDLKRPVSAMHFFTAQSSSGGRTLSPKAAHYLAWNAVRHNLRGSFKAFSVAELRDEGVLSADGGTVQLTVTFSRPRTSLQLGAVARWLARRCKLPPSVAAAPYEQQLCHLLAAAAEQRASPSLLDSTIGEVLLRRAAHAIGTLHTLPAYLQLPRAVLERLVARPDLNAKDEEEVLGVLAPWLLAKAEAAVAAVLRALNLSRLSFTQLSRMLGTGGVLHAVCERHEAVRALLKTELAARMRRVSGARAPVPEGLVCPITHELFEEAVMLWGDGHTYSKKAVEQWLRQCGSTPRSPLTNQRLDSAALKPNWDVRIAVDKFRSQHGPPAKRRRLDYGGTSTASECASESSAGNEMDAATKVMALVAGWGAQAAARAAPAVSTASQRP